MDVTLFLIVYRRSTQELLEYRSYPESNRQTAVGRRRAAEIEHAGSEDVEIALLGASDEHQLRRTHQRYFSSNGVTPVAS